MDEMMRLALEMPEEMGRPPHDVHDKDGLMRFGQEVAEVCDGEVRDHKATVDRWAKHSASVGDLMRVALCFKADYQVLTSSAAEWAVDGFPSVVLGAKYAAALCATSVPEELTKDLRCPWPSWVLEVPDGLLKYKSVFEGHEATVRRLLISQFPRPNSELRWDWTAFTNDGTSVFQFGLKTKQLVEREKDWEIGDENVKATATVDLSLFPVELADMDSRTSVLVGRLILGVCLAMEAGHVKRAPKGPPPAWRRRGKKTAPLPSGRVYVLGAPIQLDCRPTVQDYINGKRSAAPSVQHVVRGHWKNQPHGELNAHRKRIWVIPYWRGPDGAPVLLRDHVSMKE